MGVVGVLAGFLVTLINPAAQLRRARDTQRKSDLSRIQSAIEIFRADLSAYPCVPPGSPGCAGVFPAGCGLSLTGGVPPSTYMSQVPCDPLSPTTPYIYTTNVSRSLYCLRACLQNTNDTGKDSINNFTPCQGVAIAGCSGGKVSYTVQNP